MKKLLLFIIASLSLSGLSSCSSGYPETEEGVLHVYHSNNGWVYVYRDQTYTDLQVIPNKEKVSKVWVSSRVPSEDKDNLSNRLANAFGEKVEVIYARDSVAPLPPIYRHPIIFPRPVVF